MAEAALATITEPGLEAEADEPDVDTDLPDLDSDEGDSEPVVADANALGSEQAELAADPSKLSRRCRPDDRGTGARDARTLRRLAWVADPAPARYQRVGVRPRRCYRRATELEFDGIDVGTFEQRRIDYQQSTQEAFFSSYQITETVEHVIRPGESLWILARRRYQVPVWLLRQFNPDLDFDRIKPGMVVKFPSLRAIGEADTRTQAAL